MIPQVLESVQNVEKWPIISLLIFFTFFVAILIYVVRTDKNFIKKMKEMPLHDGTLKEYEEKNKEIENNKQ